MFQHDHDVRFVPKSGHQRILRVATTRIHRLRMVRGCDKEWPATISCTGFEFDSRQRLGLASLNLI
jgi:hypothetical protein